MHNHEYIIIGGLNRAQVGRFLAVVSALIASSAAFFVSFIFDFLDSYGIPESLSPIISSFCTAGLVFGILYQLIDNYFWRNPIIAKYLRVPDLRGNWKCYGQSLNLDGSVSYEWSGEIYIWQTWDRIRIRLKTGQSTSNSEIAALMWDDIDGYRLIYSYKNEPKIAEKLAGHRGFGNLLFDAAASAADGEYFNGVGRNSFGRYTLRRV